jgi:hypothetical protein
VAALRADERTEIIRPAAPPPTGERRRATRGLAVAAALLATLGLVAVLAALGFYGDLSPTADDGVTDGPPAAAPGTGDPTADVWAGRQGTGPSPGREATSARSATPSGAAAPSPAPATPSPAGTAAPEDGGGDRGDDPAGAVPAGYRRYTAPAGWSVAVPEAWREVRDGPRIDFRGPDGAFLRVDSTDTPAGDPLTDWQDQEAGVSRRLPGYERISLEQVDYRGWDAADWRFTFSGDDSRIRVLNRNIVVADDQAHALYYSAPEGVYDEAVHEVASATFAPE